MKKIFFGEIILFSGCLFFSACHKKYTCYLVHDHSLPVGVDFIGFQPSDLDTIICVSYRDNDIAPVNLISRDTLSFSPDSFFVSNDTVYYLNPVQPPLYTNSPVVTPPSYFFVLKDKVDYQVILPKADLTYTITGTKDSSVAYSRQSNEPCPNRVDGSPLNDIHINGVSVTAYTPKVTPGTNAVNNDYGYVYIKKQ